MARNRRAVDREICADICDAATMYLSRSRSEMKLAPKNAIKLFGALSIKLNCLALLARYFARIPTVCVNLQNNTPVALEARVSRLDLIVQ